MRLSFLVLVMVSFLVGCKFSNEVDLIVYHGRVYTVNETFAIAEAFAVKDGKIVCPLASTVSFAL